MMLCIIRESVFLAIFVLMSLTYALFSSSTPDDIGLSEMFIGLLLVILVGVRQALAVTDLAMQPKKQRFQGGIPAYIQFIFLYFLTVPTVTGIFIFQNDFGAWVRDIIPLLYFFLPVLIMHRVQHADTWRLWIVISLCVIGISFSIRHFTESGHSFMDVGSSIVFGTEAYFTQDPAVPFAGAFLTCYGIWLLIQRKIMFAAVMLGFAVFPWLAVLGTALRAPLGLMLLAAGITTLIGIYKSKHKVFDGVVFAILILMAIGFLADRIGPAVGGAMDLMLQKQERVGQSGRLEEFAAVIDNADTVPKLLFGEGWGGSMPNPTGLGAKFRFTHNVISYFILKSGLIGMVFVLVYLIWIARKFFSSLNFRSGSSITVFLSIGVVLLIHLILEPGYKMLPLGIIFMLIVISTSNRSVRFSCLVSRKIIYSSR